MSAPIISPDVWNNWITSLPGSHLLQTWEWGQVKAHFGWEPLGLLWRRTDHAAWQMEACQFMPDRPEQANADPSNDGYAKPANPSPALSNPQAAALLLQRTLALGGFSARLRILYSPKGPLLDWSNGPLREKVLDDIQALARQKGAILVKLDPDVCLGEGIPGQPGSRQCPSGVEFSQSLGRRGWLFSNEQVQFRNTVLIDLSPSEDDLLAGMKQKTRYNIRLAERKGVSVRVGAPADWGMLYRMYAQTSLRDGFVIRGENYYRTVWELFSNNPLNSSRNAPVMEPLIAEVAGAPVAAVIIYRFAGKAWYLSGMSTDEHREKMPNYLLQWEAMRRAKAAGCRLYDFWGAPDNFVEDDPLWGVYRFKEGLGGKVSLTPGAWDYPARPFVYRLYTQILPRLLEVMRRRGKERTKQMTLGN